MMEQDKARQDESISPETSHFNHQVESQYPAVFDETQTQEVDRVLLVSSDGRYCLDENGYPIHLDVPSDMSEVFRRVAHANGQSYEDYLTEGLESSLQAVIK